MLWDIVSKAELGSRRMKTKQNEWFLPKLFLYYEGDENQNEVFHKVSINLRSNYFIKDLVWK